MPNIVRLGGSNGGGGDPSKNPFMNGDITFNKVWKVGFEVYDGKLYAEAIIATSGTLTVNKPYLIDIWGIGGGGGTAKGKTSGMIYTFDGYGGGGYTNMLTKVLLSTGTIAVTIGAAGTSKSDSNVSSPYDYLATTAGGATKLGNLFTANGGKRGLSNGNGDYSGGAGGNNGGSVNKGTVKVRGGQNGTPGEGYITSKFRSVPHNTDYGRTSNGSAGGWSISNKGASATPGALVLRIPLG